LLSNVLVTVGLATFTSSSNGSYVDAVLFGVLALFIYLGHRWAMIAAMVLWILEKGFLIVLSITANVPNGGSAAMQILWWCVFMHPLRAGPDRLHRADSVLR
jgi:hypothetical protein